MSYPTNNPGEQPEQTAESALAESKEQQQGKPGIDYTKDFIWGSDQDEYIDEA